jgi:CspA family cold shock protein
MSQKLKGTVKWFNDAKGYGFIEHSTGRDVFVHFSVIEGEGYKTLKDGEPVEYDIVEGEKGLHAKSVRRLNPPLKKVASSLNIEVTVSEDNELFSNLPKSESSDIIISSYPTIKSDSLSSSGE